mmetsp:Transcript_79090/g.155173  ORF Transcript_79090/g.155173 Transcript_79090/m.155173 type:complete len:122 (-) Transcript_79090:355-720(-)
MRGIASNKGLKKIPRDTNPCTPIVADPYPTNCSKIQRCSELANVPGNKSTGTNAHNHGDAASIGVNSAIRSLRNLVPASMLTPLPQLEARTRSGAPIDDMSDDRQAAEKTPGARDMIDGRL